MLQLSIAIPPYIQQSFFCFHSVISEQELIQVLINSIVSFNPDLLVTYEVSILFQYEVDTTGLDWLFD